jgi:oxalyl-CoA decarboxylase
VSAKKQQNVETMRVHLAREPVPMDFYSALRAIRDVLDEHRGAYVVSEGANTLDNGRNILNM